MLTSQDKREKTRALLVGVELTTMATGEAESLLEELKELVSNLDIEVAASELVYLRHPHAPFFLGTGKMESIIQRAKALDCDLIVFDNELSPAQQRNWETESGLAVIDRQEVILDIFAERAHTKEAVLQVELAYWEYALPRLKRAWTHLSRQRGGRVTQRGEGEKQIELDQRLVQKRIARLKHEIQEVVQHRAVQRKQRLKVPVPTATIVGYTNAGKSSLLNAITGSDVLAEDKLFATLDPTTRRVKLKSGRLLLLTDTVGFVRRLPHRLVDAFKATLEEALHADFIIHVMDVSNLQVEQHRETTLQVLQELGVDKKDIVLVFNKIDAQEDALFVSTLRAQFPNALFISAKTGQGMDLLYEAIEALLESKLQRMELLIPYDKYEWVTKLHEVGAIDIKKDEEAGVHIIAHVPRRFEESLKAFAI
jgi:GTP-binding protein HflX